jgi:hypothetical protein
MDNIFKIPTIITENFGFFVFLSFILTITFAIDISNCQTISSSGTYSLTSNLTTTNSCITITAENDCQGFIIVGKV